MRKVIFVSLVVILSLVTSLVAVGCSNNKTVGINSEKESVDSNSTSVASGDNPEDVVRSFCMTVAASKFEDAETYCASDSLVKSLVLPEVPQGDIGTWNPDWFLNGSPYSPTSCVEALATDEIIITRFGRINGTTDVTALKTKSGAILKRKRVETDCFMKNENGSEDSRIVDFEVIKTDGGWKIAGVRVGL